MYYPITCTIARGVYRNMEGGEMDLDHSIQSDNDSGKNMALIYRSKFLRIYRTDFEARVIYCFSGYCLTFPRGSEDKRRT